MPGEGGSRYLVAWAALVLLTALSFGFARLDLGAFSLPAALGIAALKGTIVVVVFMHVGETLHATRMVVLVNLGFVLLLCLGVLSDVAFR